ncbi:hypothetical protein AD998_08675 [bacterium 336/3]|nr:hypothetical protein AD998_08675 [bacterium 336/3]
MMIFLEVLMTNMLFIIGLHESTKPSFILYSMNEFLEKTLPSWLYAPLLGCVYCMSSVWGVIFYSIYFLKLDNFQENWFRFVGFLPIYILALNGLVHLGYELLCFLRNRE